MRQGWGIRSRLWLAAALPAVMAVLMLLAGFLDRHGTELSQAMLARAKAAAAQLGAAAEFPLFAGDVQALQRLVNATLKGDSEILGAGLFDQNARHIVTAGLLSDDLSVLQVERGWIQSGSSLLVAIAVKASTLNDEDLFAERNPMEEARAEKSRVLGYVVLEIGLERLDRQKHDLLIWSVLAALGGLLLAAVLSAWIASGVTGPIAKISEVVQRIRDGELQARADVSSAGVLEPLAHGINAMASKVSLTHEQLQMQIQLATEELRRQKEVAERVARTDTLTGLASRMAFTEMAEIEIAKARRYNQPLSLVLVDLDFFKRINDTYGHATGDAVLISFARTIKQEVREVDTVGRLGGEEFAVLLPNVPADEARQISERMREAVAASEPHTEGGTLSFTASFGVTQLEQTDTGLSSLLGRADRALYDAKRGGRNRVALAT